MHQIDINCDLGEGSPAEAELMPLVTSANIACGGHAGDALSMRTSVQLAQPYRIAIGAHPSFPDREHFGRRERSTAPAEVHRLVTEQTQLLQNIARAEGACVRHVKLHGALYNQAARDRALAWAVLDAVTRLGPEVIVYAPAGSVLLSIAREQGVAAASEVFADRTYQSGGTITPRSHPNALIEDPDVAIAQVLRLVLEGKVRTIDGADVELQADTMCVHGDGPNALALLRALRRELAAAGVHLAPCHA